MSLKSMNGNGAGTNMARVVLLGTGGVGKSALVIRYISNNFEEDYDPTIENCHRKQVKLGDEFWAAEIIDTAGQEGFSALQDNWIRSGEGFLLVYSVTNRSTFQAVKRFHESIMKVQEEEFVPITVVGNKCDLAGERTVSTEEGQAFAKELGAAFIETSAKTKVNDEQVFLLVLNEIKKLKDKKKMEAIEAMRTQQGCCTIL